VRSFLFNHVLAERVRQNNWDSLLDGDVVMLEGTRSVFAGTLPDPDLSRRCREFDLHPTGPLPGAPGIAPERAAATVECSALEKFQDLVGALCRAGVESDRRSLRLRITELEWEFHSRRLELRFTLPPGAYATTVIDELASIAGTRHA
jgi:tRNA pseudouridine13 synthase